MNPFETQEIQHKKVLQCTFYISYTLTFQEASLYTVLSQAQDKSAFLIGSDRKTLTVDLELHERALKLQYCTGNTNRILEEMKEIFEEVNVIFLKLSETTLKHDLRGMTQLP